MTKIFEVEHSGDKTILHLKKAQLLADDNESFKEQFSEIFPEIKNELVLDYKNVDYISSLILASLVYVLKKITDAGKKMLLVNVSKAIKEIFEMTNLDKVFTINP